MERAHPRSRGENAIRAPKVGLAGGSSPLTRGKRELGGVLSLDSGLIPAHAGKTYQPGPPRSLPRAHPRSRGENALRGVDEHVDWGSSPLTRGKHHGADRRRSRRGLIPAHAGKTSVAWLVPSSPWAHPRSRGENRPRFARLAARAGSSPLTRGKRAPGGARRGL